MIRRHTLRERYGNRYEGRTRGKEVEETDENARTEQRGEDGAPEGTRTPNPRIRSAMLYPLSYGRRMTVT